MIKMLFLRNYKSDRIIPLLTLSFYSTKIKIIECNNLKLEIREVTKGLEILFAELNGYELNDNDSQVDLILKKTSNALSFLNVY
jgi:hypothetical protein